MATKTVELTGTLTTYKGTGNNLAKVSSPEAYYAGSYTQSSNSTTYKLGTVAKFDIGDIDISKVTSIKVEVQRIKGGSSLTYTVSLYRTVLTASTISTLRTGYSDCTDNRTGTSFTSGSSTTEPYTLSWSIAKDQWEDLFTYGWAMYVGTQTRYISIGYVKLYVTYDIPEYTYKYTLNYNTLGGSEIASESKEITSTETDRPTAEFTIASDAPKKSGYKFNGWSETEKGEVKYTSGSIYTTTLEESTIYAVWKNASACHLKYGDELKSGKVYTKLNGTLVQIKPYCKYGEEIKSTK